MVNVAGVPGTTSIRTGDLLESIKSIGRKSGLVSRHLSTSARKAAARLSRSAGCMACNSSGETSGIVLLLKGGAGMDIETLNVPAGDPLTDAFIHEVLISATPDALVVPITAHDPWFSTRSK